MLSLYALAAFMALIPACIIGEITNFAADHQLTAHRITLDVAILFVSSILYAWLSFLARRRSYMLGETVFAQLREEFLAERAGAAARRGRARRHRRPPQSHDQRHRGPVTHGALRHARVAGRHRPGRC